jgi:2-C-methyl-D-erythritol 4-phosphate cytidylyltransferase
VALVWSIVVAGGAGRRFGDRKQFSLLGGRPVLHWAVEAARTCSAGVVLVLPAEGSADHDGAPDMHGAAPAPVTRPDTYGADAVVAGGPTRADSVRCGLAAVPEDAEVIVVHDAARPLATPDLFAAVIEAVTSDGVDGAVPGVRPSDTIKAVDAAGNVTSTLHRDALVAVQTPQAFRADVLRRAHKDAGHAATDDAMLVEALGATVRVVPGDPGNLKITAPGDLDALERLLTSRGR